jgi:hypothetical protein
MKVWGTRGKSTLILVVCFASLATPAKANLDCTDDAANWWCPPNANAAYYWPASVPDNWKTTMNNIRIHEINPSAMNTSLFTTHNGSTVHVQHGTYPGESSGWILCASGSGGICNHFHVFINNWDDPNNNLENPPWGTAHRKFVSCNEFCHASGLAHHQNNNTEDPSCMYVSHVLHNPGLNDHDYNHIASIV